jgi:aromatic-amino-acid transaminase
MALVARPLYSMPPDHGSAIVRTILEDEQLTACWQSELEAVRRSIVSKRLQLSAAFRTATGAADFDYLEHGMGMFSLLKMSREEIDALRRAHGIYIVEDGRINLAGLQSERTTDFVRAVLEATVHRR